MNTHASEGAGLWPCGRALSLGIKMGSRIKVGLGLVLVVSAIGCAEQAPAAAPAPSEPEAQPSPPVAAAGPTTAAAPTADAAEQPAQDPPTEPPAAAEPAFTPGMSVAEATAAVPSNASRLNIEQERLAEPLQQSELYDPCALQGHQKFSLTVAVWDGRAVGVDVSTQPNNDQLAKCLRAQVETINWQDRAKSLNTVQISY